ncbi:glycosyltransferase family 2 protein [Sulfurovum sp. zt1-1]|uniref:Glycosyltransferase family 2 protein n=1 Tax=Sulfurovum zhangzhouensis TaxID=3019067 RepID=A0ABT7QWQ5_9BACT|nr:glycosyltransferase family 2 protein [Sulfurovum zhangzhouensis]MDM5271271.1 glycosyltransferase family 2 protein [Sulfurovum zhangzhouensis]
MTNFLNYFLHKFDPDNFTLVMTILVKNEADIIEANIRTHAALGVDAFVVMDNDSTDGTREILVKLQNEFEILLIDEKGQYNQAKWMKQLAHIAKNNLKADWVINNDADEFWLPANDMNLKENLAFKGSVLTVNRYNMILDEACHDGNFFASTHYVENPVFYTKTTQLHIEKISMVLTKIGPKTIVNPNGLIGIRGGNHKAWHLANTHEYLFKKYDQIKKFDAINVYHYPFRSYEQFEKNIKNRKLLLESKKHIRMGPHYRRWVKLYNEGKLEEEFHERLCFKNTEIEVLKKYGILTEDNTIQKAIKQ